MVLTGALLATQDAAPRPGRVVTEIDRRIWCIDQGRDGDLWFGSNGNGVYRYDGERVVQYTRADGLSGDLVRDIEQDRKGNVLVSTTAGVSRFDGRGWTQLEVEVARGRAGWRLDPGDVWIVFDPGTGGPCRYDGEKVHRLELPRSPAEEAHRARFPDAGFAPDGIYSIYEDRRGHLWFGTAGVGLCRYDGRNLSWMYEEELTTTPGGGAFGIRSIHEDEAGDFWICNTRQRFRVSPEARLEDGVSLVEYEELEGLPGTRSDPEENFAYFPSMTEGAAGSLWMACGNEGVWRYDGEVVAHFDVGDGAYALSLFRDREGRLWVGTLEHGVHVLDGERFEPFEPREAGR
jgi:ligand-binding sensor domain-containing protein